MAFGGFTSEAFEFYEGLQADNSKSYWAAHRETYERHVREPMEELCAELEDEFGPIKLFRPYRDLRFSKDKSPYKTHQGGHTSEGFYLQLDADGLMVAGGMYAPTPEQLRRYREAVGSRDPRRRTPGRPGRSQRRRDGDRRGPAQDPSPRHAPRPPAPRTPAPPLALRARRMARRPVDGRPGRGGDAGPRIMAPAASPRRLGTAPHRPARLPGLTVLAVVASSCILVEARATGRKRHGPPVPTGVWCNWQHE